MSRHGKRSTEKSLISIIVPLEMKAALVARAEAENRTLSNYLATHITAFAQSLKETAPAVPAHLKVIEGTGKDVESVSDPVIVAGASTHTYRAGQKAPAKKKEAKKTKG